MLTMRQLSAFEALTDSRLEKDSDNNSSNNSPARRRLIRHHRRAMRERRVELCSHVLAVATAEGASALTGLRAEALRLRPCSLSAVFTAAGALELGLPERPERLHLAELVLSLRPNLPVSWREGVGEATGSPGGGVLYACALTGQEESRHPLRLEMGARLDAATARAEVLLVESDSAEGVQWDDGQYASEEEEEEEEDYTAAGGLLAVPHFGPAVPPIGPAAPRLSPSRAR